MIIKNTVLILGAGASVPYGFPTMDQLRSYIIKNFRDYYWNNFTSQQSDENKAEAMSLIETFIERFRGSNLIIDEFLSEPDNKGIRQIGKLAIICALAEFERKSRFREDSYDPDSDWYTSFYLKLFRSLPINERYKFWKHNFQVITLNYEHSFEHFIYDSLIKTYVNRIEKINKGINNIEVIHVYGRMARLDWQFNAKYDADPFFVPYGKIDSEERHIRCTTNIDIMYTSRQNNNRIKRVKNIISAAKRLLFVGFGFDQFNLNNLGITDKILDSNKDIVWTQYKLDEGKEEFLERLLQPDGNRRIAVDGNAKQLIDNHLM